MQINADFEVHPVTDFEFHKLPKEIKNRVDSGDYKGYLGKKDVYLVKQDGYPASLIQREDLKKFFPGLVPYTFSEALSIIKDKGGSMRQSGRAIFINDGYLEISCAGKRERWTPQVEVITSTEEVWLV